MYTENMELFYVFSVIFFRAKANKCINLRITLNLEFGLILVKHVNWFFSFELRLTVNQTHGFFLVIILFQFQNS